MPLSILLEECWLWNGNLQCWQNPEEGLWRKITASKEDQTFSLLRKFRASQGSHSRETETDSIQTLLFASWGRSVGKGHLMLQRQLLAALQDPEASNTRAGSRPGWSCCTITFVCLCCFLLTFALTRDTTFSFLLSSGTPLARCITKV